ncbi:MULTISPECIES: prepilin-type N-terminal cleavage/methylation domain-containing protein [Clostridium]|uniref:prepilin-type N-terminal cleavage/methylation domain-containing protein n=1 Tax=Clostridium TaxID=1485 RepID=UPI0008245C9F|nr:MULTISPECIES: prepilin-type N-terminal cleavage/methylation domain-containing protein [Clostridium]PJI07332.1 general secretion pathway protein [Clostridium sp. CT7]
MKNSTKRKGFTLIELIIVIAIIAILAAILVPSVSAYKKKAEKSSIQASARTLSHAIDAYNADDHVSEIDSYNSSAQKLIVGDINPAKVPSCLKDKSKDQIDNIASGNFTIVKENGLKTIINIGN